MRSVRQAGAGGTGQESPAGSGPRSSGLNFLQGKHTIRGQEWKRLLYFSKQEMVMIY